MNDIIASFGQVLEWPTIGFLILGTVIGLVVGVLPGVGGVFAMTVTLPIVITAEPINGMAMLIAIFAVAAVGGEVTSILFAVPGEPGAEATIMDGHPLTRQGKAGLALGVNLTSNLIGGFFGAIILFLFIPVARPIILALGTPELFLCILVGIAFVGSLAGRRPMVGFMVAALGAVLSMVGTSVITGAPRFTFGFVELWGGLPLVSFALGLFAVPELFAMYRSGASLRGHVTTVSADFAAGARETIRHWRIVISSSGLGVVLGMIPGLGAMVTQWISYALARRMSKHPEKFGKGAVDGLIAPSATCNSKDAGQLIPTLFFGVPSGVSMALLLVAMLAFDVTPGPRMVTDHLQLTYSIAWILVVANVVSIVLMALSVRLVVRLASMPAKYLMPVLMVMILMGAYGSSEGTLGIAGLVVASILGVLMKKYQWPRAPFVLAFVLAPLAEQYLFLSIQNYGMTALYRPGVIILLLVLVGQAFWLRRGRITRAAPAMQVESGSIGSAAAADDSQGREAS